MFESVQLRIPWVNWYYYDTSQKIFRREIKKFFKHNPEVLHLKTSGILKFWSRNFRNPEVFNSKLQESWSFTWSRKNDLQRCNRITWLAQIHFVGQKCMLHWFVNLFFVKSSFFGGKSKHCVACFPKNSNPEVFYWKTSGILKFSTSKLQDSWSFEVQTSGILKF